MALSPGTRIGRYEVRSSLGAGGMGEVYLAEDTGLRRNVALKILPDSYAADPARKQRFLREAMTASTLSHPNVAAIYEAGEGEDGTAYLTMEHVSGETLGQALQSGTMSIGEIVEIGKQIADALDEARHQRIVHRDLKPGNIMVDRRGQVKILDFGIAKALQPDTDDAPDAPTAAHETSAGTILGTAAYMSPEQTEGRNVDHRSDIFSVGAVLYELVTGKRAFRGNSFAETASNVRLSHPPKATQSRNDCPAELERIISRCLEKDRERRYQTARELLLDLQGLAGRITPARASSKAGAPLRTAVAAAIAASLIAVWMYRGRTASSPPPAATRITSVAVLPFVNVSAAPEAEFMSDGVTDELINALARLSGLKVVSRTSVFAFKGTKDDVREIARKLGVESVVEGSVRRSGNRLRVTAQLVAAKDGYNLWSDTYERELTDVFVVQNDIATAVARALQAKLTPGRALIVAPTRDVQAYELYLQGRQACDNWTSQNLTRAISLFQQAIARDPAFAPAYAGLAGAYSLLDHGEGPRIMGEEEAYARAIAAARKALELDPNSAEADAALGHIFVHQGRVAESEAHLKRAIELNPNYAAAYQWYGVLLVNTGQPEEGRDLSAKARELDPRSPQIHYLLSMAMASVGDFNGAADMARHGVEIAPDHAMLRGLHARGYALAGRHDEAERVIEEASRRMPSSTQIQQDRALVFALAGRRADALAVLEKAARNEQSGSRTLMMAYAALGDDDQAIEVFERMVAASRNYARLNFRMPPHPAFDSLRADPRYQVLYRELLPHVKP